MKAFFSSYLAHLTGYIVSAAGLVGAVDPKLVPPQYAAAISLAGLVTLAAHNGYKAGNVGTVITAATNAALSAAKAAPAVLVGFLLVASLGLNGCATMQKIGSYITSPAAQPVIQAAAFAAVATAEQHGVTAAQIQAITAQALAADQSTSATLTSVGAVINAQLAKLNLPAGDLVAIQIVEVSIGSAIQSQVGGNATLAQTQVAVADVLKAVQTAAGGA